jgi:uncharacterized membrane protein YesL
VFGRFMNNYYYGKSGKGDYRKEDLPTNRMQLFWEMLRVRLAGLFRLNLMTIIAWIPLVVVLANYISNIYGLLGLIAEVDADKAAATAEQLRMYEQSGDAFYSLTFMALLYLIPCIAITGPFQAGMAYVTRNWSRDEHAFVWSDFKDAFKDNWKQALGVSLITGVVPLLMLVSYRFYGAMASDNVLFIVPQMLVLTIGGLWMLALVFLYPMMVSYKVGFRMLIKNSFLLAVGRLPQTLAVRLIMLVPTIIVGLLLFYTPYGLYALMGLAGYYLLIGNGLARFVYASFANAVFDKFINPNIEGAVVNRGIVDPDSLDDEDDDEDEEDELPTYPGATLPERQDRQA